MKKLFGSKNKYDTIQRHRIHRQGVNKPDLRNYCQETLGTKNIGEAVVLPKGEDLNEWLSVHTLDFYNEVSLLYGTVQEFCTEENCPVMSAGPKWEYLWADGAKYKKPVRVSAPRYVELLLAWVEEQLECQEIFPQDQLNFPPNFHTIVRNIFKRLFRVYAHIYHSHIKKITGLGAEKHLNTCFKHFIYFVKEFKLIDDGQQECMREVINTLFKEER